MSANYVLVLAQIVAAYSALVISYIGWGVISKVALAARASVRATCMKRGAVWIQKRRYSKTT